MSETVEPATARRNPLRLPVILAVAAALLAAGSGWWWYAAAEDDGVKFAELREQVRGAGERAVAEFNSLDYRRVDEGMRRWLETSTGALHEELRNTGASSKKQIEETKTVTTGRVTDAAVTELDDRAGKAKLIAAVEIEVAPDGAAATTKRNRFQAELTRTETGWKLSGLGPVPVAAS
ncbi:hypothetical protein N8J89_30945 [Crossiella sp. CA-258035]|uniref:hypothetical protein n=1 Tax=Crossiella sp. CA-258035 TaxID=2981138 RepID=UPI0024BCD873|nr:hypothetical protein [Crossiella sp. CA-258035]WHT17518.1 hypothetical protein N8J89_30945 [Crossiella sp. CA-258035]